jgi:RNA polymerase sigma-70 factor (sigma-E family)
VEGVTRDEAFEACFDALFPKAFGLALRVIGDAQAAEDVAAEALTRLYARWARLRAADYRDAWVMKVAGNLAIDAVRKHPAGPGRAPAAAPDMHDLAALRLALAASLGALPRRQRQAIALRYFGDMTEDEVARSLGVSTGAVKSHIHRGLRTLRSRLGPSIESIESIEEVRLVVE